MNREYSITKGLEGVKGFLHFCGGDNGLGFAGVAPVRRAEVLVLRCPLRACRPWLEERAKSG